MLPRSAAVLALLLPAACGGRKPPPPPAMVVSRLAPALGPGAGPVLLNQELTVFFSAPLDPATVTSESVAVLDAEGRQVPGRLRIGQQSVTFVPRPPLRPELDDGSLRPEADYRLVVAGYPRPDGIRAADGRMLQAGLTRPFRTVPRDTRGLGLPSPLLPVAGGALPFLLRAADGPLALPLDRPRPRLQFTLPILPTSLSAAALEVSLLRGREARGVLRLLPAGVRLCEGDPAAEALPGSVLEVELGREVQVAGQGERLPLEVGDVVVVGLAAGPAALLDYGGRPVAAPPGMAVQWWEVVAGSGPGLLELPGDAAELQSPDGLLPGFEVLRDGSARPLLRVEAGDGSLGLFRPRADTVLRPGRPFDRGDGVELTCAGPEFPFLAIHVPPGVTVRVDAGSDPVQLLACGRARIEGTLLLVGPPVAPRVRAGEPAPVRALFDSAPVTLLAAGGIDVPGRIVHEGPVPSGTCPLVLAGAGPLELKGPIPPQVVLAVEANGRSLLGAAELALPVVVRMTPGLAGTGSLEVVGALPWRRLPAGSDGARLELLQADAELRLAWQVVAADPFQPDRPDARPDRWTPPEPLTAGSAFPCPPGAYVRLLLQASAQGGKPLAVLRRLRLAAD